jgi:hypothetical protein
LERVCKGYVQGSRIVFRVFHIHDPIAIDGFDIFLKCAAAHGLFAQVSAALYAVSRPLRKTDLP